LSLRQAKIDEDALSLRVIIKEISGFDIAMEDSSPVDMSQGMKETSKVMSHIIYQEVAVV